MAKEYRTLKLEILAETKQFLTDMNKSGKEVETFGDKAKNMGKAAAAAFAVAAAAAAATAAGLANVKQIQSQQYQSASAGGGGAGYSSAGSSPASGAQQAPTAPTLDLSFLGQGAGQSQPIQAYVLAENVSNAQQANQKIQDQATL